MEDSVILSWLGRILKSEILIVLSLLISGSGVRFYEAQTESSSPTSTSSATTSSSASPTSTASGAAVLSIAANTFLDTTVGNTSSTVTFTVTNSGTASATLGARSLTTATHFTITGGTCSSAATIAAAATCTIIATFNPGTSGALTDTILLPYNDGTSAQTATRAVSANGLSIASFVIAANTFANTLVTATSAAVTFTLTNTGGTTGTLSLAPALSTATQFAITGGTCTNGATVAAAATCTILATFTPTTFGTKYDTITVTYDDGATAGQAATRIVSANGYVAGNFISVWQTTAVNETITLPLRAGYNYNFTVDWGDETTSAIAAHNDPGISHVYSTAGNYTIIVSGTLEAWYFNDGGDKTKIIQVVDFGDVGWINLESAFDGCTNLTSFAGGTTTNVTNMSRMFMGATGLTTLDLSTFGTEIVTDMSRMFESTIGLSTLDLSNFDTANVANMDQIFGVTTNLTKLYTTGWNLGLASGSSDVFTGANAGLVVYCDQGGEPGTGNFFTIPCGLNTVLSFSSPRVNTYVINSTKSAFALVGTCATGGAYSTTITFGGAAAATTTTCVGGVWSKLVDVSAAADGTISISITQNTTTVLRQFKKNTTQSFISVWQTTTAGEAITFALRNGYNYNFSVDWGDGSSENVIAYAAAISHNYAAAGNHTVTISGTLEAWYAGAATPAKIIEVVDFGNLGYINLDSAFYGCTKLRSFTGGSTASVTNMSSMFSGTSALTSLDLSSFNTASVTNMSFMFYEATALTTLDVSNFHTTNVTNMSYMFGTTSSLTSLDLQDFNTLNVTNMYAMFSGASALTSLTGLNFNTANVTNMAQMFENLFVITSLDLSSFATANVTNMNSMFINNYVLATLDVSNFNTANVTLMYNMFHACNSLTALNLSHFNTAIVTNMTGMFRNTTALTSLNTTNWNIGLALGSGNVFTGTNAGLVVTCNQGGPPATGTFFGKNCQ